MTRDEIAKHARGYAIEFCREHGVTEQDADDYIQEGIKAALLTSAGKTTVQKALLYQRVRGAIMNYHKKWTNGGIGGRDAPAYEHVYLADTIPGTSDDDGDPVTYDDITAYEDPPNGYDEPSEELETLRAKQRVQKLLPLLNREDRELVHFLYFSDKTQQEVAVIYNVTQQSIQERARRVLKKLRLLAL